MVTGRSAAIDRKLDRLHVSRLTLLSARHGGYTDRVDSHGRGTMNLVERLKGILLAPKAEWPKIAAEPMTTQGIYTGWVMILAAIGPLAMLLGFGSLGFAITHYVIMLVDDDDHRADRRRPRARSSAGRRTSSPRSSSRRSATPRHSSPASCTSWAAAGGAADPRRVDLRLVHVLSRRAGAEEVRAREGGACSRSSSCCAAWCSVR